MTPTFWASLAIALLGFILLAYCLNSRSEAVGFVGSVAAILIIIGGLIAAAVSTWW